MKRLDRYQALRHSGQLPSSFRKSLLERLSINSPTQEDYQKRAFAVNQWASQNGLDTSSPEAIVYLVLDYLDELFLHGHAHGDGSKTWAAIQFFVPRVLEYHEGVARVQRALRGWVKRAPESSRFPIPAPVVFAIVGSLCRSRDALGPVAGLMVLVQFLSYLRPGDLVDLRPADLVESLPHVDVSMRHWALLVRASAAGGKSTKTGEFDQSVVLDSPGFEFLDRAFRVLKGARQHSPLLWPLSMEEYGALFHKTLERLQLHEFGLTVYALRHAGASWDLLTGQRDLLSVKERGFWRSETSMRRYTKAARSLQMAGAIPVNVIAFGNAVKENFTEIFDNQPNLLERLEAQTLLSLPRAPVRETANWAQVLQYEPA